MRPFWPPPFSAPGSPLRLGLPLAAGNRVLTTAMRRSPRKISQKPCVTPRFPLLARRVLVLVLVLGGVLIRSREPHCRSGHLCLALGLLPGLFPGAQLVMKACCTVGSGCVEDVGEARQPLLEAGLVNHGPRGEECCAAVRESMSLGRANERIRAAQAAFLIDQLVI